MRWFLTGYGTPIYPILLLTAIAAKLIGTHGHGGIQFNELKVVKVTISVDSGLSIVSVTIFILLNNRYNKGI